MRMKKLDLEKLEKGQILFQNRCLQELLDASGKVHKKFDHVAIVIDKKTVIEATAEHGVALISIEDFLKEGKEVYIGKIKDPDICVKAADISLKFLGYPYNYTFEDSIKRGFYCSQLVTKSFQIANGGTPYFKEDVLNFRNDKGEVPKFWIDYYKRYNMNIPEGVKGSHPSRLFEDEKIVQKELLFKKKSIQPIIMPRHIARKQSLPQRSLTF